MEVDIFQVGPFAENTYLLSEAGEALLIDPGFWEENEYNAFLKKLEEREAELRAVLLTHAHVDHVLGLQKVLDDFDVPVYLNDTDRYLWNNFASQAGMFGFQADGFDFEPEVLAEQDGMELGPFRFEVRYTPGHAPDHVSLYFSEEGFVIAGDVLFRQGIGRTDLYKGDFKLLEQSIRKKLYDLDGSVVVYPGHGPETTIGYERKNNPFVSDTA